MPIFEIDFFKVQGVQKYFLHTIFADNSCLKNQTVVEHTLLSRVCNDDTDFGVFACGGLKEFATQQDGEADRFGRFRKPDHNDREYNATIVCPIYYVENSKIHITGAICIDTTSSYKEWNNSGSYEEEIITFVSSNIGPLLKHNIDEFNLAEKIIRKVS